MNEASEPANPAPGAGGGGEAAPPPGESTPPDQRGEDHNKDPYGFGTPPADDTNDGNDAQTPPGDGGEYALSFDEASGLDDGLKSMLTDEAKGSGLDAGAASSFITSVLDKVNKAEEEAAAQSDAKLKEDWGRNYESNMKSAASFAHKVAQASGLSLEDLGPLQSPNGFRVLHALSSMFNESPVAGAGGGQSMQSNPAEEANRILSDPEHPLHEAILNPSHHRHKEAHATYDRLIGISK